MIKGKKYIATLLTIASIIGFGGMGTSIEAKAADSSDYLNYDGNKSYEGKDSNGLTWKYYKNNDGTIILAGTSDLSSTIEVPSVIDGCKVTRLNSIVRFYPSTEIHGDDYDRAESDGKVVNKVILPDTLEYLGDAFDCCNNLTNVDIPKSVKYINIYKWSQMWLDKYTNSDGLVVINNILINGFKAKGKVEVPSNVTEIADNAFSLNLDVNTKITEISIPSSVKRIGASAFYGCNNLKKVKIEEGVQKIDDSAFKGCSALSELEIPNNILINPSAFEDCASLKNKPNGSSDGMPATEDTEKEVPNKGEDSETSGQTDENKPSDNTTGWKCVNGIWYYINENGSKKTGWFFDSSYNSWFYLDSDGSMKTGWLYDSKYKSWFYMNSDGSMKTGWLFDDNYGAWFYLNENGSMKTGWFYDNKYRKWYYLNTNGILATNTYIGDYYVNDKGEWNFN